MTFLILGVAILAGLLLAGHWFVSAEPKSVFRIAKWLLIGLVIAIAVFLLASGRTAMAFWTLPVLLPWLLRARAVAQAAKNFSRMSGANSGMASAVTSAYLDMSLDHDTGDMDGTIRKGDHAGSRLSTLGLSELTGLFDTYSREDGESARLLAAFLDRMHPTWRGQGASADEDAFASSSGHMSRDEALRILGLGDDVTEAEIKSAYHRLIAGLHPDRGGSAYLAAKINEARDVLLKD
ncbi:MAG: DnaJ domain-containing protein [Rhodospirillales bacterium]